MDTVINKAHSRAGLLEFNALEHIRRGLVGFQKVLQVLRCAHAHIEGYIMQRPRTTELVCLLDPIALQFCAWHM